MRFVVALLLLIKQMPEPPFPRRLADTTCFEVADLCTTSTLEALSQENFVDTANGHLPTSLNPPLAHQTCVACLESLRKLSELRCRRRPGSGDGCRRVRSLRRNRSGQQRIRRIYRHDRIRNRRRGGPGWLRCVQGRRGIFRSPG